jgi:hypothetical protein
MDAGGYGVHKLVELAVFQATAASNVRPAAHMGPGSTMVRTTVGESSAAWQEARGAGYGEVGPHGLLLFAVDEYAMLSQVAERLLRECIVIQEDRLDVEGRFSTWSCRAFSLLVILETAPVHHASAQTSERDQCDARFTILRPRPFIRDFRCRAEHLVRIDEHEFVLKNLICDYYVECY